MDPLLRVFLAGAEAIPMQDALDLKALAEVSEPVYGEPAFAGYPVSEFDIRVAWFLDNGDLAFPEA
jgi:hypothetical protein